MSDKLGILAGFLAGAALGMVMELIWRPFGTLLGAGLLPDAFIGLATFLIFVALLLLLMSDSENKETDA